MGTRDNNKNEDKGATPSAALIHKRRNNNNNNGYPALPNSLPISINQLQNKTIDVQT